MSGLEVRLKKIVETRNYLLKEINHDDLMSENYRKTCKYLSYVKHLLILVSTVTGCVSISAFVSKFWSSAVGIKICAVTAGIKNYKSIIKKNKKKHDKIVLLGKTKLDAIDSNISHGNFVLVKNVLKEYN